MLLHKLTGFVVFACVLYTTGGNRFQGEIDTQEDWVFLFSGCFYSWEGFTYKFEFPSEYDSLNLLLYFNRPGLWESVDNTNLTCLEKEDKLNSRYRQIIDLRRDPYVDCTYVTSENIYRCQDFNYFRSWHPSWWYFVISRCNQTGTPGIRFKYDVNMTNFFQVPFYRDDKEAEEICTGDAELEEKECMTEDTTTITLSCDFNGPATDIKEIQWYLNDATEPYAVDPFTCKVLSHDPEVYDIDNMEQSCDVETHEYKLKTPTNVGDRWSCTFGFEGDSAPTAETILMRKCKEVKKNGLPAVAIAFIIIGSLLLASAFIALGVVLFRKGNKGGVSKDEPAKDRPCDVVTADEKTGFDTPMAFVCSNDLYMAQKPPIGHMDNHMNMYT